MEGLKDYVKKNQYYDDLIYMSLPKREHNRYDILEGGFSAVVYTITDNTMHLILMWGAYNLLY
ncbi:MAG: hypothetical protein PF487_08365 [Bacteroidales bacterium]|nr:hypothetical protein [Bacteroidales bacterium]